MKCLKIEGGNLAQLLGAKFAQHMVLPATAVRFGAPLGRQQMRPEVFIKEPPESELCLCGHFPLQLRIDAFGEHGAPFNDFHPRIGDIRFRVAADFHRTFPAVEYIAK